MYWKLSLLFLLLALQQVNAQDNNVVYKWSWQQDGLKMGLGTATVGTGFYLKSIAPKATSADLLSLDPNNVWGFDRGAVSNYSSSARRMSDIALISGIALPIILQFDKRVKHQNGAVLGMALETLLITQGVTTIIKSSTRRFRPFTYNSNLTEDQRLTSSARESFLSGHVSTVSAGSFFTAKVLTDLYPDSKLKPLIWTSAAMLPAITGYLRYKAGRHFPTDIIGGYALGALTGILIPSLHKASNYEDVSFDVSPISSGLVLSLRIPLY